MDRMAGPNVQLGARRAKAENGGGGGRGGISSPEIGRPEKPGPSSRASHSHIFWDPISWKSYASLWPGIAI